MNDWYFYQEQGKTLGPLSGEEIKARLRDGRLRVFDLLYRDGETKWKLALEHAEFSKEFKSGGLSALKSRPWVCLQRKIPAGQDFITSGPYSTDEIRAHLQSGKVAYSDYTWKDGFGEWKRIGSLEEFNRRARGQNLPPVPSTPGPDASELLKDIVEFKRPTLLAAEPPPPEADKKDLALSATPLPPAVGVAPSVLPPIPAQAPTPAPQPSAPAVLRTAPRAKAEPPPIKKRRLVDLGIPFALLVVLLAVIGIVSRLVTSHAPKPVVATELPPQPPAPTVAAAPPEKEDDEPPPEPPKPKPKPSHPATELSVTTPTATARVGKIDIRTDASSDFQVLVQVVGLPGQLSDGPAFYRELKIAAPGNAKEPLDLSAVKLPLGKFILRAQVGELKKEIRFNNGTADPAFKGLVVRQRKLFSTPIFKERLQLFKLAQGLEKQLISTKGHLVVHGLEALKTFKTSEGSRYLLFEDWLELRDILKEAQTAASPDLIARAQKEREHLASFSVWH